MNQAQAIRWLRTDGLKSDTEEFIIISQDQCLKTNYYRNKILKANTNPICKIYNSQLEIISHIVPGCDELAKTEYIERHNKATTYLHNL